MADVFLNDDTEGVVEGTIGESNYDFEEHESQTILNTEFKAEYLWEGNSLAGVEIREKDSEKLVAFIPTNVNVSERKARYDPPEDPEE